MTNISIKLSEDLLKKMALLAEKNNQSINDIALEALSSYVNECEDIHQTDLCAVDNLERSFFLSIAE